MRAPTPTVTSARSLHDALPIFPRVDVQHRRPSRPFGGADGSAHQLQWKVAEIAAAGGRHAQGTEGERREWNLEQRTGRALEPMRHQRRAREAIAGTSNWKDAGI